MYKEKKIFVLGMARSGYEAARLLSKYNNKITITDIKKQDRKQVKELMDLRVRYIITDKPEKILDNTYDVVVKNPGIPRTNKCVIKAKELGIKVINELEVAYELLPKINIIGVTGSNGKTTTTTLIYEILKKGGVSVHVGGNIGMALSSMLPDIKENDTLVLEISDHQLVDMYNFKTNISILTNLYHNHLDFHDGYDTYKNVKKKIFNHHTKEDIAIINNGNEDVVDLVSDIPSTKATFSAYKDSDCMIKDDYIVYKGENIIKLDDIKVQGNHNYENIMCAIIVAKKYNISNEIIKEVLSAFTGVEHRLEFVRTLNGRNFYNDSKSTNTDSTVIAVDSFKKPTILIMGGLDRGHTFETLNDHISNVKEIICYGETKDRISQWCNTVNIKCSTVDNLIDATNKAYENSRDGDVILLSPACASWDQYKCFEDRGNEFKKTVKKLK